MQIQRLIQVRVRDKVRDRSLWITWWQPPLPSGRPSFWAGQLKTGWWGHFKLYLKKSPHVICKNITYFMKSMVKTHCLSDKKIHFCSLQQDKSGGTERWRQCVRISRQISISFFFSFFVDQYQCAIGNRSKCSLSYFYIKFIFPTGLTYLEATFYVVALIPWAPFIKVFVD